MSALYFNYDPYSMIIFIGSFSRFDFLSVIGASRSEPHTGDTNRDFPFIYVCIYIYISAVHPSVPYIYLFYFNDVHSVFFN